MKGLKYLVSCGKNRETAWSGTNFSLYKALGKYFEVNDINLNGNRWTNAFMSRVIRMDGDIIEYYRRHQLGMKLRNTTGSVFQFSEVFTS